MSSQGPALGLGWRAAHHAELLVRRPALDWLEVHSENYFAAGGAARGALLAARAHYPISLHGVGLSLGSACGLDRAHLRALVGLVDAVQPRRVSEHVSFARVRSAQGVRHAADLLPVPTTPAMLAVLLRNVDAVQTALRRPIALEHLSAYLRWSDPQALPEPVFLTELARRSGARLLLDVNNLYVNACNDRLAQGLALEGRAAQAALHASCVAWLQALPADLVCEIHLAGHSRVRLDAPPPKPARQSGPDAGADVGADVGADAGAAFSPGGASGQATGVWRCIDDHGSAVRAPVWALYRHALQRFGAQDSLIEWDTDLPTLDVLLAQVALARRHAARVGAPTAQQLA